MAKERDLALDVVRAWSLLVVVFGHFIMQILYWDGDIPTGGNTLSSGNVLPYLTWLLQVMPLFFVAGGAVNSGSFARHSGEFNAWLWQRVRRLSKPTVVFLAAMSVVFTVVSLVVPREITDPLVGGITGPLWFLSVYFVVTALTPVTYKWWQRSDISSLWILFALAVLVDYLRLNVLDLAGIFNLVVAWVLVHQLGYWFVEGVSRRIAAVLVVVGLSANVLLTQVLHWYPTSLVGIPTEDFSNMAPPTVILIFHSLVLFGGFVLLAPWLRQRFSTPRASTATSRAGMLAMTIYLWHMFVLVMWLSALHLLGLDLATRMQDGLVLPDEGPYWLGLIPSTIGFAVLLYLLVGRLWKLEFAPLPWFDSGGFASTSNLRAGVGVALCSLSLLAIAGAGFSGFPLAVRDTYGIPVSTAVSLLGFGLGLSLLRQRGTVHK